MREELPEGWVTVSLGEVLRDGPTNGYSPPATANATGTLSLKLSATTSGEFILNDETTKRLAESIPPESKFWLEPGDVLVQRANTLEYVGTAALFNGPAETYVYPDLMMRIRPHATVAESAYLWRFINSGDAKAYLRDRATGTAGNMPKINGATLRELPVFLPPLREQRRIVHKIEALASRSRRAKEALDAIPALLERFRQSVLAAAFRGDLTAAWREKNPDVEPAEELLEKIRAERRRRWEEAELAKMRAKGKTPGDDRWKEKYEEPAQVDAEGLPELPDGWSWALIGDAFDVKVGATPSRSEPAYWGGDIPWVSSGEVAFCRISSTREHITEAGLNNSSTEIHPPGTVLLGMIGEGKTRGQTALLDIAACNNQNAAAIRVSETPIPPEYVYRYLEAEYERTRSGSSGNNQPALNKSRVQAIPFALAPLREQAEIVRRVEALLGMADGLRHRSASLRDDLPFLDRAILSKAFRGELVPQDPADEPASVLLDRLRAERAQAEAKPKAGRRGRKVVAT